MLPLSLKELGLLVDTMIQMQDAATRADWQELTRLDGQRRKLLKFDPATIPTSDRDQSFQKTAGYISANSDDHNAKHYALLVDKIHNLDKQILDTVQTARQQLLSENRELSAQRNAKKLYAQTSAMS